MLRHLEAQQQGGRAAQSLADDLPLFNLARPAAPVARESDVEAALKAADLDSLSPRQALDLLFELKGKLAE